MAWTVVYTSKAERDLGKIPDHISLRIRRRMDEIAQDDPRRRLRRLGHPPYYKLRTGDCSAT